MVIDVDQCFQNLVEHCQLYPFGKIVLSSIRSVQQLIDCACEEFPELVALRVDGPVEERINGTVDESCD